MDSPANPAGIFEIVYCITDYYDGPRQGIADFQGKPHLFQSGWNDGEDLDCETFQLMHIDEVTFELALEAWSLYRRWEAVNWGTPVTDATDLDAPRVLPEDRSRWEELEVLLEKRLSIDPSQAITKTADFRVRSDPNWSGRGLRPLEVRWLEPT